MRLHQFGLATRRVIMAAAVLWVPSVPLAAASLPAGQTSNTPSPPRNLSATASGPSVIDLSWAAPSSSGASAIIDYRIEVSADGGGNWVLLATRGAGVTAYSHSGLSSGATRAYRVRARNAHGAGLWAFTSASTGGSATPSAPRILRLMGWG